MSTTAIHNGPFLTVNQSMFTEVEVANQWYCRAHNNLCPTLPKNKKHVLFVCEQTCEQLTLEWIENGKRTIDLYIFISKCGTVHSLLLQVEITTRQLLSHMGGIRHYSKDYITKMVLTSIPMYYLFKAVTFRSI